MTGIPWPHENAFNTIPDDIKKSLKEIEDIILGLSDEKTKYATTKRNVNQWFFRELGVESRCFDAKYAKVNQKNMCTFHQRRTEEYNISQNTCDHVLHCARAETIAAANMYISSSKRTTQVQY